MSETFPSGISFSRINVHFQINIHIHIDFCSVSIFSRSSISNNKIFWFSFYVVFRCIRVQKGFFTLLVTLVIIKSNIEIRLLCILNIIYSKKYIISMTIFKYDDVIKKTRDLYYYFGILKALFFSFVKYLHFFLTFWLCRKTAG